MGPMAHPLAVVTFMQRPKLDAADGVIEAADFALGLDKLPTGAVEVPADERKCS